MHEFYLTGETGKRTITNFKFLEFAYAIIYVVCKSLEVFILFGGGGGKITFLWSETDLKRKKENWKQPLNLLILVENSLLS